MILQVGLGKACELVVHNLDRYAAQMKQTRDLLQDQLVKLEGVRLLIAYR